MFAAVPSARRCSRAVTQAVDVPRHRHRREDDGAGRGRAGRHRRAVAYDADRRRRALRVRGPAAGHVHAHHLDDRLHLRPPPRRRARRRRSSSPIPLAEGTGTYQRNRHGLGRDGDRRRVLAVRRKSIWARPALADLRGVGDRRSDARDAGAAGRRRPATISRPSSPSVDRRSVTSASSSTARRRRCCCTRSAATDDTGSIAMINTDILSHGIARWPARIRCGTATGSARRSSSTCAKARAIGSRCAPP